MAAIYANVSNAFRQPVFRDIYISLIVEALLYTGNGFTVPRSTDYIVDYVAIKYPLFPLDLTYLDTQLNYAVKIGVLSRCVDYWQLRQDMTQVNVGNQKYLFGRCSVGGPLITTCANYGPVNSRSCITSNRMCGSSSATSTRTCCIGNPPFTCGDPEEGCCAPVTNVNTA